MNESVWPTFKPPGIPGISWFRGLFPDRAGVLNLLTVLALVCIYLIGIFVPISGLPEDLRTPRHWWFLSLFDELFTGGAWGRRAIFSVGLLASIVWAGKPLIGQKVKIWGLLKRVAACLTLSALAELVLFLNIDHFPAFRQLFRIFLCLFFGCMSIVYLNFLLNKYKGPQIFHLNIIVLLFLHFFNLTRELLSGRQYFTLLMMYLGSLFIIVSALHLLRKVLHIEVFNIKDHTSRRFANLSLHGIDALSMELLATAGLNLFIIIGGLLSFATGFRILSCGTLPFIAAISIVVCIVMAVIIHYIRIVLFAPNSPLRLFSEFLIANHVMAFCDPRYYAQQLINNYWIIPNVQAGYDTQSFIEIRMQKALNQSLLVFASWILVMFITQAYSNLHGPNVMLYPYGPFVSIFLLLMFTSNINMLLGELRNRSTTSQQIQRGKHRVLIQSYHTRLPDEISLIDFSDSANVYWKDDRLTDNVHEIVQLFKSVQSMGLIPNKKTRIAFRAKIPLKDQIFYFSIQVILSCLTGAFLAFLGGALYVSLATGTGDLWAVVIPLFLTGFLSPNLLRSWVSSRRH
jgi:hypothetical protein